MKTVRRFFVRFALGFVLLSVVSSPVLSSTSATITGRVTDSQGLVVPGAQVQATNILTNISYNGETNEDGLYHISNLPPGEYRVIVQKDGFASIAKPGVELHVQDIITLNFAMQIGSVSQTITVEAGAGLINTESATVSTIVDRRFVEDMLLNGRSFQTLIALTPGVVLTPAGVSGDQGQFSVSGQRSNANYFSVDGVSANIGASASFGLGQSAAGAVPGFSAQGGTNSLVSVDAMEEFRIQTSSFAPEFGRTPGGQVSIVTRSGTNQFHGTLFDYLRNDVLDANDWFANRSGLPKPRNRQNDFGGTLSGPFRKDRTFFFVSYEGLRLRQPLFGTTVAPSTASANPAFNRQAAPPGVRPFLDAYLIPNGTDLGNGFAQFNASYSNPSTLDAYSIRVDHALSSKLTVFGRYNYSPSKTTGRSSTSLSSSSTTSFSTHTLTLGLTQNVSSNLSNEVRANYSNSRAASVNHLDDFGGAVAPADTLMFPAGFSSANGVFLFSLIGGGSLVVGNGFTNEQRQVNLADNLSVTTGAHQLKFGVDYRRLSPFRSPRAYQQAAIFLGMTGPRGALSGTTFASVVNAFGGDSLLSTNFSLYGQDTWRVAPRLTLTYGLRWEVNPPLKGSDRNNDLFTVRGLDNPATLSLAPRGTSLYETTYGNVAPRIGVSYQLSQRSGRETVLRGGFGLFYDLGSGSLGAATAGFPFTATKSLGSVAFPLTSQQAAPPAISLNPPVSQIFVADPNLKLPRTYQWNVAVEQSLGTDQSMSATYVGALGRKLLRQDNLLSPNTSFTGSVNVTRNTAASDYHALQVKFQRRLSRRLQGLASYTFAHSIDIASGDAGSLNTIGNPSLDRGNSDFDVRHSMTAAVTYDVPSAGKQAIWREILANWSLHSFVLARSAPPINLVGPTIVIAGAQVQTRPNVVPGIPLYLFGPQYAGSKILNNTPNQGGMGCKGPFCNPPAGQQGNLGRNVLRAFSAWQIDFAAHREFHLTERLGLQFRAEFFNLFNHPNFGFANPANNLASPLFGQSTQMLGQSLGSGGTTGGLNPLYQIGGPRSIQFALKLTF